MKRHIDLEGDQRDGARLFKYAKTTDDLLNLLPIDLLVHVFIGTEMLNYVDLWVLATTSHQTRKWVAEGLKLSGYPPLTRLYEQEIRNSIRNGVRIDLLQPPLEWGIDKSTDTINSCLVEYSVTLGYPISLVSELFRIYPNTDTSSVSVTLDTTNQTRDLTRLKYISIMYDHLDFCDFLIEKFRFDLDMFDYDASYILLAMFINPVDIVEKYYDKYFDDINTRLQLRSKCIIYKCPTVYKKISNTQPTITGPQLVNNLTPDESISGLCHIINIIFDTKFIDGSPILNYVDWWSLANTNTNSRRVILQRAKENHDRSFLFYYQTDIRSKIRKGLNLDKFTPSMWLDFSYDGYFPEEYDGYFPEETLKEVPEWLQNEGYEVPDWKPYERNLRLIEYAIASCYTKTLILDMLNTIEIKYIGIQRLLYISILYDNLDTYELLSEMYAEQIEIHPQDIHSSFAGLTYWTHPPKILEKHYKDTILKFSSKITSHNYGDIAIYERPVNYRIK